MQPRRPRRRRSALLRLCASDSPVPHTKGLPFPTFCCFSAFGALPSHYPGLRGAPGRRPRRAQPLGRPPPPRQTSPNLPQTRRAGEGPRPEARMRPACCSAFPGLSRAGVESGEYPRRPARPLLPGQPGFGCCLLSLEPGSSCPGARLSALLLSLRMEVSKRGSWKRRAGEGTNGLKAAGSGYPRLARRGPEATKPGGSAGSPRAAACRGSGGPGRRLWRAGFDSGLRRQR